MSSAATGARRFVAVLLALVAVVAVLAAVGAGAIRANVLDTDGFVDAIARPLGADPAVKEALASELADQVIRGVDLAGNLEQWVPPAARSAVRAAGRDLEARWRVELQPSIRRQFDAPGFAALWEQANASAHRQLVDALADRGVGDEVVIDLHGVLVNAVREAGVAIDQQLGLPGGIATAVFDGIARGLPAELGRLAIDLSRVGDVERFVVRNADDLVLGSALVAVTVAALALLIADARARGVVLALMGALTAMGALALSWVVGTGAENAGARVRGSAGQPLSTHLQVVVDAQAKLMADAFASWADAAAIAGLAVALAGVVVGAVARNRWVAPPAPPVPPATAWPDQRWS